MDCTLVLSEKGAASGVLRYFEEHGRDRRKARRPGFAIVRNVKAAGSSVGVPAYKYPIEN